VIDSNLEFALPEKFSCRARKRFAIILSEISPDAFAETIKLLPFLKRINAVSIKKSELLDQAVLREKCLMVPANIQLEFG